MNPAGECDCSLSSHSPCEDFTCICRRIINETQFTSGHADFQQADIELMNIMCLCFISLPYSLIGYYLTQHVCVCVCVHVQYDNFT